MFKISRPFNDDLLIEYNMYSFYFCLTNFNIIPIIGNNHIIHYFNPNYVDLCWYFIWLGLQFEIGKTKIL